MNKKTIIILLFAVAFTGIIFVREYIAGKDKSTKKLVTPEPMSFNLTEPKPETDSEKLIITTSSAITFLLSELDEIYYYKGMFTGLLNKSNYQEVGQLIKKVANETDPDDLMFIIKSNQGATFKNAIDILDEMVINKVPPGHYAEIAITKEEIEGINILKKTKNG